MKLTDSVRSLDPEKGMNLIEQYIFPTLKIASELHAKGKIVAGGPVNGSIQIAMIVCAESPLELDEILEGLPVWPLMDTRVTPITTFEDRLRAIQPRLERLKKETGQRRPA
jgi:muconolactone delta-isomerase